MIAGDIHETVVGIIWRDKGTDRGYFKVSLLSLLLTAAWRCSAPRRTPGIRAGKDQHEMLPQGPICQSCAMPLEKAELRGTNADGSRSTEYCAYCYRDGKFADPAMTMDQMIEKCVAIMTQRKIMSAELAGPLMRKTIPSLKRWKER